MDLIKILPIGRIIEGRSEVKDDGWDQVTSVIEIDRARFEPDCLAELTTFTHVEVVFYMDRVNPEKIVYGARHPRNNPAWPMVGVFAQRVKNRPNQIATTICKLAEVNGLRVKVTGLDAVVGSPVLDLKPYVREFGPRGQVRQPEWMTEMMRFYWTGRAADTASKI